jgi:hypothetical protein
MVDDMKTKTCPHCNGDGVLDKGADDEHQCPVCGDSGVVYDDDDEEIIRTQPKLLIPRNSPRTIRGSRTYGGET